MPETLANSEINCKNGGTQINKDTCICPGGIFGKYCESYLIQLFCKILKCQVSIERTEQNFLRNSKLEMINHTQIFK